MDGKRVNISVVVPLYNENGNISHLVDRIVTAMVPIDQSFEIILVDDGSTDETWKTICAVASERKEVIGVRLSRNFGHQGALLAGLRHAKGNAVISMDGDLQHPPEKLIELVRAWRDGAKIVTTRRLDKYSTTPFKRLTSKYFYRLFSSVAETKIEPGSSDFRLLDRKALDLLLSLNYGEPFLRGAVQTLGFEKATIEYDVENRFSGVSKYTLGKMVRFARHGLISHSSIPLKFGIYLGLVTGAASIFKLTYVLIRSFQGNTVPGWASTLGVLSLLFSVLFIILGIVGLYLADMHRLLKQQPHFIVAEVVNNA